MAAAPEGDAPKTPEQRLRASVLHLEQLTGRRAFVLVRPFDHLMIGQIEDEIARVLGDDPQSISLDVVLESDGGSADAAYKSVLVLRQIATDLRVLVPRWAKSAATLFALGSDVIAMRPALAELGPLDAQVIDPRNPVQSMSALDGYQSVEYLRDYALQTQNLAVLQVMEATRARIPLTEIIAMGEDFAVDVISPIMSSIKPLDFGGWGRTLDIGKAYAERLLSQYSMAGAGSRAVRDVASRLVYGYPHHSYVIDVEEALDLGLTVEPMDTPLHRAARDVTHEAFRSFVQICDGEDHHPESGYCGFAPLDAEEKPTDEPQELTEEARKEDESNGTGGDHDGELRQQRAEARHT